MQYKVKNRDIIQTYSRQKKRFLHRSKANENRLNLCTKSVDRQSRKDSQREDHIPVKSKGGVNIKEDLSF